MTHIDTNVTSSRIKVFISHAHGDQKTATALTDYLAEELGMSSDDIRCSSVAAHMLPAGKHIAEQLRNDIEESTYFIALLSYFGVDSPWVKFELGAAWINQRPIIPILGPGIETDHRGLGPISAMPCVSISDEQCIIVFTHYLNVLAKALGIEPTHTTRASEKLQAFVNTYRNWGGIHADFSQAQVHVLTPQERTNVEKLLTVKADLQGIPLEGAFVWVAITNASSKQIWPKEIITDPQRPGEHTIEISENGTPAPGELGVCVLGVGHAGNARLRAWLANSEKTGNWSGIDKSTIPGMVELACVDGLTLLKKK